MKMTKKQFRIGELAKRLQVKRFVIRFWEKEFELLASRSSGKQRFYDEKDYETFIAIKQLLYNEKFTISGAKKQLKSEKKCMPSTLLRNEQSMQTNNTPILTTEKTAPQDTTTGIHAPITSVANQMIQLREKLIKLHELL